MRERVEAAAKRAGRDPGDIEIIGVTKGAPPEAVAAAIAAGLSAVGENRVQEAMAKRPAAESLLAADPNLALPVWHLVGHLQRNKVRAAIGLFDWIDAVDSLELARELSRRLAGTATRPLPVLIEIKTAPDPTKHGISPEAALDLVPEIGALPGLEVRGLMTMAPLAGPPQPAFRALRSLSEHLQTGGRGSWTELPHLSPHLSMGMSGDFEVAVEEGATLLRLGRVLFGPRPGDSA